MPVHDAMYTHAQAEKLLKALSGDGNEKMKDDLKEVQKTAVKASMISTDAARDFFTILQDAMKHDDPKVRELAHKIYYGPYHVEIA